MKKNRRNADQTPAKKIEELTLYVIDLKKENEEMRNDNAEMKTEIEKLKRR